MFYSATVTSKRQITIPSNLFKKLNLGVGSQLVFQEDGNEIKIVQTRELIESLAGSVKVPKKLKNVDLDTVINQAKQKHFRKKSSK